MAARPRLDRWRLVWRFTTSDNLLAALLLLLAGCIAITGRLPQMPTSDPVDYAKWLSLTRARFGTATRAMQSLGLFTVARSFAFRFLLALLGGSLMLRLVERAQRLIAGHAPVNQTDERDKIAHQSVANLAAYIRPQRCRGQGERPMLQFDTWTRGEILALLAHVGGLLLLAGLLLSSRWGWRVEGQIVQSGIPAELTATEDWIALDGETQTILHSPGIVPFVQERGPGAKVSAADRLGNPLLIYQTTDSDPVALLTVALTEDQYFAVPEARWIVRLARQSGHSSGPNTPILVQVYQSPTGVLIAEESTEGETELNMTEGTLRIESEPFIRFSATCNPGLWPSRVGLVLLIAGLLSSTIWPAHHLLALEEESKLSVVGDLPPALTGAVEA